MKSQKLLHNLLDGIRKTLWFLARDAFLFILVLALLSIVIGEFLFYNYVLVSELNEMSTEKGSVQFKEGTLKSVIKTMGDRETMYKKDLSSQYQNPF